MTEKHETKILATLGPSSMNLDAMRALIRGGADGFRFNMSHLAAEELAQKADMARRAASAESRPIALVADLSGPKIRVGSLPGGQLKLKEGDEPVIGVDIPISCPEILADIKRGDRLLMDDGKIELEAVSDGTAAGVKSRVRIGGALLKGKGLNLPETELRLPAITAKDLADIPAAVQAGVDYMSLSFVQEPDDVIAAGQQAKKYGRCPGLIAKIERPKAVSRFQDILAVSDGVMIARGDLGIELPVERVPVLQKEFIRLANSEGKTVVTATQMLESMTFNPRPTRAEASDVANAVWDGTDAVMLSGETAVGRYPVETVKMMRSIIVEAEKVASPRRERFYGSTRVHALATAAVDAADALKADAIVAVTVSGFTAKILAQRRPSARLIALVPNDHVRNCLALVWGVVPVCVPWRDNFDAFLTSLENALLDGHYVQEGDTVVLVSGSTKLRGIDFMVKIHEVKRRRS